MRFQQLTTFAKNHCKIKYQSIIEQHYHNKNT